MIRGIARRLSRGLPLPVLLSAAVAGWILTAEPSTGFPILEYHMVKDDASPEEHRYVVPPADFAQQLDYLAEEGYTTITPQDYARINDEHDTAHMTSRMAAKLRKLRDEHRRQVVHHKIAEILHKATGLSLTAAGHSRHDDKAEIVFRHASPSCA